MQKAHISTFDYMWQKKNMYMYISKGNIHHRYELDSLMGINEKINGHLVVYLPVWIRI